MHEASLVRSLLTQVEQLRAVHGGGTVTQIEVEIGPLSGVEALLVRDAFSWLAAESNLHNAELVIHETELQAVCNECGNAFTLPSFRFECPHCESRHVRVTHGDQFRLLNVTMEICETTEASV